MTLLCCCFSNFCEWFLASGFKVQSLAFNSLHRATIKTTKPFKFYRSKKSQIRSSNLGSPHHAAWSHTRTYSRSKSLSFAGNRMNGVSAAYCKTSIPSQQTCVQFMNGECIHWMHSPFNELHSWMHSLLKMVNVNVNAFTVFSEWWIDLYNSFSIHFRKHKMDFLMRRERWKLYLFIKDIAFNKINFEILFLWRNAT